MLYIFDTFGHVVFFVFSSPLLDTTQSVLQAELEAAGGEVECDEHGVWSLGQKGTLSSF